MKYILCYGDSNTWGMSPDQLPRFDVDVRWPGILQRELGTQAHIYENGLCGRTTGLNDDIELGRNGRVGFETILEINAPLDLVIIMLGSNDCKKRFSNHPAWDAALNIQALVKTAKHPMYGTNESDSPKILVISPIKMKDCWSESWVGEEFDEASTQKADMLASLYLRIAHQNQIEFMDAAKFGEAGKDCLHMTKESHLALGRAVSDRVREILALD